MNLALVRLFARSPRGQRAHGQRPHKRGRNVSILSAISLQGLIVQLPLLGAVDGLLFEAFIAQKLVPKLWSGAFVIMDNCSIHKGAMVESLIHAAGATVYVTGRRGSTLLWEAVAQHPVALTIPLIPK